MWAHQNDDTIYLVPDIRIYIYQCIKRKVWCFVYTAANLTFYCNSFPDDPDAMCKTGGNPNDTGKITQSRSSDRSEKREWPFVNKVI